MIKSIVYEYHFSPSEIEKMYCDNYDFKGILYWYEDLVRISKESKKKQ